MAVCRQVLLLVAVLSCLFTGLPISNAQSETTSNISLNQTTLFFEGWHGSPPGGCGPTDTSNHFQSTPDFQTCSSPGGYITTFEIVNGSFGGFPGVWQITGVCNDGQRLDSTPSNIDVAQNVQGAFITNLSLPQGWSKMTGLAGYRVDQILGVSPSVTAGVSWQDDCPAGTLISGYQGWAVPPAVAYNISCNAAGMRFQCNGSLALSGWSEQSGIDYPGNDIYYESQLQTCNITNLGQLTSFCKAACLAMQPACVGFVIGATEHCCWLKSYIDLGDPSSTLDKTTYLRTPFLANQSTVIASPPNDSVNASTRFFQDWHGSPPGGCNPNDNSGTGVLTPDQQTCPSGGYITAFELYNGTYLNTTFRAVWQMTAVCSDGSRLSAAPADLTNLVSNITVTTFNFPQGMANISGRSGVWMDQLLGDPPTDHGGSPWQDTCPEGSLLSGYEGWVSPLHFRCIAGGFRFQCNGSLPASAPTASPNAPLPTPRTKSGSKSTGAILAACLAGGGAILLLSALCCCLHLRRKRRRKDAESSEDDYAMGDKGDHLLPTTPTERILQASTITALANQWRHFSRADLETATNSFHEDTLVGEGAFGRVYRGSLADGTVVAIKELKGDFQPQQQAEFLSELRVLSRVRHRNLVGLCGYTYAQQHMYLVFEFAKNGGLDTALRGADRQALTWETRLGIAVGAARGLSYLHNDVDPRIIHRDVKASNILLDENLNAQVADFGMATLLGAEVDLEASKIRGTFGYLAPEYAKFGRIGPKCDVYSFGVVLMELVTASRAVISDPASNGVESLVEKVLLCGPDECASLVDPRLEGAAPVDQVTAVLGVACACVHRDENLRPGMLEVLRMLERVPGAAHSISAANPYPISPSLRAASSFGDRTNSVLSVWSSSSSSANENTALSHGYEMSGVLKLGNSRINACANSA